MKTLHPWATLQRGSLAIVTIVALLFAPSAFAEGPTKVAITN